MRTKGWICCFVILLTACQGGKLALFSPTPTPFPEEFSANVDIGEELPHLLPITCKGSGEPTIILESGLGGLSWTDLQLMSFRGITRTCFYRRWWPTQDSENTGPRTTMDQVNDLHNLLQKAGVPGPYILVGHSIAGYNLPLYANQYPEEVVGLVCVDCRPAKFSKSIIGKLEAADTLDPEMVEELLASETGFYSDWTLNGEHLDDKSSTDQVMTVTDLGEIPFVVLVASDTMNDITDQQIREMYKDLWRQLNQELCDLSSNCRFELLEGTSHWAVGSKAVYQAVREVYEAVKEK